MEGEQISKEWVGYRVSCGFTVDPEFDSKGQLKRGIKLWMSCGFDDPTEARAWLDAELRRAVDVVVQRMKDIRGGGE